MSAGVIVPESTNPQLGRLSATSIADQIVPEYRDGKRAYSCTSWTAKRWQAAYEAAEKLLLTDDMDLRAAASREAAITLSRSVLRWCDHVERFSYVRGGDDVQMDASPHILSGETRKLATMLLAMVEA